MAEKTELLEEDEKVVEIELERLRGFENHPFKVRADSQMIELQESIKKYGILNPLIVRPKNRIFYPHGYIPMKGGVITKIVLSEDDYQNQIYQQNLWANNIQTTLFSSNTNIFIGLSLNDSNIRRLINMCSNTNCYTHYAFLPTSGEDKSSTMYDNLFDTDLYRLGIRVIRYSPQNNHRLLTTLIHYLWEFS